MYVIMYDVMNRKEYPKETGSLWSCSIHQSGTSLIGTSGLKLDPLQRTFGGQPR